MIVDPIDEVEINEFQTKNGQILLKHFTDAKNVSNLNKMKIRSIKKAVTPLLKKEHGIIYPKIEFCSQDDSSRDKDMTEQVNKD